MIRRCSPTTTVSGCPRSSREGMRAFAEDSRVRTFLQAYGPSAHIADYGGGIHPLTDNDWGSPQFGQTLVVPGPAPGGRDRGGADALRGRRGRDRAEGHPRGRHAPGRDDEHRPQADGPGRARSPAAALAAGHRRGDGPGRHSPADLERSRRRGRPGPVRSRLGGRGRFRCRRQYRGHAGQAARGGRRRGDAVPGGSGLGPPCWSRATTPPTSIWTCLWSMFRVGSIRRPTGPSPASPCGRNRRWAPWRSTPPVSWAVPTTRTIPTSRRETWSAAGGVGEITIADAPTVTGPKGLGGTRTLTIS